MLFRTLFVIVESFNNRTASENVIVNSSLGTIKPDGSGVNVAVGAKRQKDQMFEHLCLHPLGFQNHQKLDLPLVVP